LASITSPPWRLVITPRHCQPGFA